MNILGLSTIGDDCAVSLMAGGELIAAASEAALRGAWIAGEFPYQAVETVLRSARLDTYEVDAVACAQFQRQASERPLYQQFFADWNFMSRSQPTARRDSGPPLGELLRTAHANSGSRAAGRIPSPVAKAPLVQRVVLSAAASEGWLGELTKAIPLATWFDSDRQQPTAASAPSLLAGLCEFGWGDKLVYVDAQRAMEASAFRGSGFQRGLVLNFAGDGFDATATVSIADERGLRTIDTLDKPFSLSGFWSALAAALGWGAQRGPDWVAALAAHGDACVLRDALRACIAWDGHKPTWRSAANVYLPWRLVSDFSAIDIAAAWRAVMCETVERWLEFHLSQTGLRHLVICGGLPGSDDLVGHLNSAFAEVEIHGDPRSQAFAESVGVAALETRKRGGQVRSAPRDVAGPHFSARELQSVLNASSASTRWCDDSDAELARLLAEGRIVARFIAGVNVTRFPASQSCVLCPANSVEIKNRLLQELRLPSFLPLTAVTTLEAAREEHLVADAASAGVTLLSATAPFERLYPAAIRPDGVIAARIVSRDSDADMHRLLSAYRQRTGLTTLLVAGLALADEPVASLPRDAMRMFEAARLDYLALGNFLVEGLHVARQDATPITA
jgi:carbamoyltransferase